MKRIIVLGLAALTLGACEKQGAVNADEKAGASIASLRATLEEADASRTVLDEGALAGKGLVKWQQWDNIGLFMRSAFDLRYGEIADSLAAGLTPSTLYVTPEFYLIKNPEDAGSTTATFVKGGESAPSVAPLARDTYFAVYPYSKVSTVGWQPDMRRLTLSLPAEQSHPFDFASLGMMVARAEDAPSEGIELSFKNLFSILKFSLTGDEVLQSILFSGNDGEPVAGPFTIDMKAADFTATDFSASQQKSIKLSCGVQLDATPRSFYMVVPAGVYAKGFTVEFVAADGGKMVKQVSKNIPKTLLRSKIYSYPVLAFEPQATAAPACDWLWQSGEAPVSDVGLSGLAAATDLGAAANCFMVTAPGTYKFKAVKGDGSSIDGLPADSWVYFTASGAKGNAVVAATVNERVVWSWHIWCTEAVGDANAASGYKVMDRNLGALGTASGDWRAYGLLYQWGRKDPFPGSGTVGSYTAATEDAAFGSGTAPYVVNPALIGGAFAVVGNNDGAIPQGGSVAYAVQHPMHFIEHVQQVNGSGVTTWFNSDWTAFTALWGSGGAKSVYDPCPAGYRIPDKSGSVWSGFTKANAPWSLYGFTFNGSFYPATGYRDGGVLTNPGRNAWYPSNELLAGNAKYYALYLAATSASFQSVMAGSSAFLAHGVPVRCQKIE